MTFSTRVMNGRLKDNNSAGPSGATRPFDMTKAQDGASAEPAKAPRSPRVVSTRTLLDVFNDLTLEQERN